MKKQFTILLSVIVCVALLVGCTMQQKQPEPSAPTAESTVPTEATPPPSSQETAVPTEPEVTEPAPTEPEPTEPPAPEPKPTEEVPTPDENTYRLSLSGFIAIFDEPSYDGRFVGTIGEDGVYTIVEEKTDSEGYIWGKLKSGAGWISLSELEANLPLLAGLGNKSMLKKPHHIVIVDNSEFMEYLVFQAKSTLTDVKLISLLPDIGGYVEDSILHTQPELTPEKPLIAEVVFYGDFTTYGLSFTDESGAQRHFAVYISGRNGAPVLQEYQP